MSTGNAFSQQTPVGPAPIQPQPAKKMSGGLKGCLIVGAVIVVAVVILIGIGGWLAVTKSGRIYAWAMADEKPKYVEMLTPDHAPEQKAAFEKIYDQMISEYREKGMIKVKAEHGESLDLLNDYKRDEKIDMEESASWLEQWEKEEQQTQEQK